ncbi:hypothetical protein LCGC14_2567340, partial [marine sediment metagenome]
MNDNLISIKSEKEVLKKKLGDIENKEKRMKEEIKKNGNNG